MATHEVRVPDIGDFTGVEIIEVLVTDGESVEVEQGLVTLETDKAAMDVPAPGDGTVLELKVKVGDKVSEGDVVAVMELSAAVTEDASGSTPAPPLAATPAPTSTSDPADSQRARHEAADPYHAGANLPPVDEASFKLAHASPSVRRFARELGVDLGRVRGSGLKSRITQDDVKAFVKAIMSGGLPGAGASLPEVPRVDFAKFGEIDRQPLSRIQKISGPRLHASWVNVPHVTQHDEADVSALDELRRSLKEEAAAVGAKLTPLAFLIRASALALAEFPTFNASLDPDGEHLVFKKYIHIGFAADTPNGLVVPVVRDADSKGLYEIAAELGELAGKARDGKLKADQMQGGCFTISSLGGIGGTAFTPIVNAPEVAILGVSKSSVRPVWDGGAFQPRTMLPLSLSYDHRVIDGASAVRFTRFLADTLEAPEGLTD